MTELAKQEFAPGDQEWVDRFLAETTLFLGPDPEIMTDHRMAPRTADEERLLSGPIDANALDRVRKRIVAGLDEAFEMMEQTGAAPGAKWGDLTSAVYSASGDLIHISTGGVLAFASVLHYPVRFIKKYWVDDPTVGVHDGDGFIHNDARYGNIHNTDQSMILPVFYAGELIAWVATIIHEGENGAKEPGGMPSSSESAYDDGIRMSPFKIVERGQIRRDLLTFLQNSVREPKLQYQDLKVKLYSALRIKERLLALVEEVGRDAFIVSLRKSLEDVEAEARRRISELPDGTYRVNFFSDSTLRENALLKYPCAITVKDDELTVDWRGAAPQIMNRAFNATLGSAKCGMNQAFLGFFWPDLPRGISVMNPIEVLTDPGSCIDPGLDAPLGQSLQGIFKTFGVTQIAVRQDAVLLPGQVRVGHRAVVQPDQHVPVRRRHPARRVRRQRLRRPERHGRRRPRVPRRRELDGPVLRGDGRHRRAGDRRGRRAVPPAHLQADQAGQPGLRQIPRRHGVRGRGGRQGHPAVGIRDGVERVEVPARCPACSAATAAPPTRWRRSRASTSSSSCRMTRRPGRSTSRR